MPENITTKRRISGKKRYIAVAALAGLVATGGVVGATVTAQSTVAGNQITVTEKAPEALVTVSGDPMKFSWEEGKASSSGRFGATTYLLTNEGTADATVKIPEIADLKIPSSITSSSDALRLQVVQMNNGVSGQLLFDQTIAGPTATTSNTALTIPAGETVTVRADLYAYSNQTMGKLGAVDKTFDVQFDYVTKQ